MPRQENTAVAAPFSQKIELYRGCDKPARLLNLVALRGGHACGHIFVRAAEGVCVTAAAENGRTLYGEEYNGENIVLYAEKDIAIERNWHHNGLPTGEYTDALLPLDTAVSFGETTVKDGKGIALFADFYIPEQTAGGIYEGFIEVRCEKTVRIPYALTVLDAKQPQEITCKSLFAVNLLQIEHYEGTRSQEALDAYIQTLLAHRISSTGLLAEESASEEGLHRYAHAATEWVKRGLSTVGVPSFPVKEGETEYPDYDALKRTILALAEESLACGIDLLSHAVFYDWLIDESFLVKMPDGKVERHMESFEKAIQAAADALRADERFSSSFGRRVIASAEKLPHVVTDYCDRLPSVLHYVNVRQKRDKNGDPYHYDLKKTVLCPKFDGYDSPFLSAPYEGNSEKWWYGCNAPSAPYIGYHMDDAPWSARYISWLMVRYGICGNLYWVVNYGSEVNTTGKPLYLEDPYGTAHRGLGANGDGVLLYPGKPYGLREPVGCLRLTAIREGNADYEWLTELREGYAGAGVSFDGIFDRMTAPFAQGVRIDTFAGGFDEALECFMRLYEGWKKCRLTVACEDTKKGIRFCFSAAKGTEMYLGGNKVSGAIELARRDGYIFLEIKKDGYVSRIPLWTGGRLTVLTHEELYEAWAFSGNAEKIEPLPHDIYRELTIVPKEARTAVRIALPAALAKGKRKLGVEIRAYEGAEITLAVGNNTVTLHAVDEWNRLDCPMHGEDSFTICFEGDRSVALGAVYLH